MNSPILILKKPNTKKKIVRSNHGNHVAAPAGIPKSVNSHLGSCGYGFGSFML